jgi:hypothetical protein
MPTVSADEARKALSADLRKRNAKSYNPLPPELRVAGPPIHIFSLWKEPFTVGRGGMGTFTIPARAADKRYSDPLKIPYLVAETVPVEIDKSEDRFHSGAAFAKDILSQGPFHSKADDLAQYGVFIAAGETPTEEELKAAEAKLDLKCRDLIQEADGFHQQGPTQALNIQALHRWAADRMNVDRPWNAAEKPMMDCPGCGSRISKLAAIHACASGVVSVIDPDKARSLGILPAGYDEQQKKAKK